MRKISPCAFALLFVASCSVSSCSNTPSNSFKSIEEQTTKSKNNPYSNPTYPLLNNEKMPTYTADPYVLRDDDGTYYMYCTQTEVYANEEFKSFKAGPVFDSIDLINWTYVSDVLSN